MATTLPRSVRDVLGPEAAEDLAHWYERESVAREEYREVLSHLDVIETRMDGLESEVAGTNERLDRMEERFEERFNQIDQRFEQQSAQFDQRLDKINERFDRMHEAMRVQTRWTVGTIALFGTIVTVLLAIAQFGG